MQKISESVHQNYQKLNEGMRKYANAKAEADPNNPKSVNYSEEDWAKLTDEQREAIVQQWENGQDQHETRNTTFKRAVGNVEDFFSQLNGDYSNHAVETKNGEFTVKTCFVAGTKITKLKRDYYEVADKLEPNSKYEEQVAIETILVGDWVLSKNDETGALAYRRAIQTYKKQTSLIYNISYKNGVVLETTWNHRFARLKQSENNEQTFEWVEAKDLLVGDIGVEASGNLLKITEIFKENREETVYNFEVDIDHTYFVGESQVWVHNPDGYGPDLTLAGCLLGGPWGCVAGAVADVAEAAILTGGILIVGNKIKDIVNDRIDSKPIAVPLDDTDVKNKNKRKIVLGESIERIEVAKKTRPELAGAEYFPGGDVFDKSGNKLPQGAPGWLESAKAANRVWLQTAIAQGAEVYKVGRDPYRTKNQEAPSPFYSSEEYVLRKSNYPAKYIKLTKAEEKTACLVRRNDPSKCQ
ncbi:hypothetical protein EHS15_04835 [Leptospira idonii]|uniref:Intein C-terminal splicing domain-containing protein n=2 Tax=Leptospira idonii TaxID=1193500 RepID=A0A4R9M0L7_9LEPT|nr:hypothetical protein EHS15_04835 [Leptospira idonii]